MEESYAQTGCLSSACSGAGRSCPCCGGPVLSSSLDGPSGSGGGGRQRLACSGGTWRNREGADRSPRTSVLLVSNNSKQGDTRRRENKICMSSHDRLPRAEEIGGLLATSPTRQVHASLLADLRGPRALSEPGPQPLQLSPAALPEVTCISLKCLFLPRLPLVAPLPITWHTPSLSRSPAVPRPATCPEKAPPPSPAFY